MSLPYTALNTFHLIVRFGNLKLTANHLHLTESAVSHQIKRLEAQLGYALFYKSGRQLKVTPEGSQLAAELAAPFDHINQALSNTKQKNKKTITIYCLPSLIELWLLPRLLSFKQTQPDYEFVIGYHSSAPEYLDQQCLRIGSCETEDSSDYPRYEILPGNTIPVCSPIYLSRHKPLVSARDLLKEDLLHDHSAKSWQDWFASQGMVMEQAAQLLYEDFHLLKMATLAGQGIALCPEALIQNDLEKGTLIALSSSKGNIGRYYAIEHNRYMDQSIKTLLDYIINLDERKV